MSADWIEMPLGDFIELKRGYDLPKNNRQEGNIPVVSSAGISGVHKEFKSKAPGVVTGRYGTLGKVFYIEEDFWPLNTTLYVKNFYGNDPLFVYYLLKTINYQDYSDKAAVPGINRNHLHTATIRVLTDPVKQGVLALKLWRLDEKIDINRQINQTLEEMAQAIFKSWFVDFDPVKAKIEAKVNGQNPERAALCAISGKTDNELDQLPPDQLAQLAATAALFPDELVDSELGLIPKGWEVKKIEEVIKRFPVGKKYSQKTASAQGQVPILDQGKSGIIGYHNDKAGVKASPHDPIVIFANHTCYMRLVMYDFSAIQNVLPFKGADFDIYWTYAATYGKQKFDEYKGHWPDFIFKRVIAPTNQLDKKYGEHVRWGV